MKKNIVVICMAWLLVFMPVVIFGHNIIKGKVLNESTNSPLPGATVQLKGTSEGTTTDEWGNFSRRNTD